MLRNFFSTPNVIGRLLIVLLFVGGLVFAGAFNGFVVETDAQSCCGDRTDTSVLSDSSCCEATETSGYTCSRKPSGSNQKYCKISNGTHTRKCSHDCSSGKQCSYSGC